MADREIIGHLDCPLCGEETAVKQSKNARPYLVCSSPVCGYQGFARGAGAVAKMREKMRPVAGASAAPAPADAAPALPKKPAAEFGNWLGL